MRSSTNAVPNSSSSVVGRASRFIRPARAETILSGLTVEWFYKSSPSRHSWGQLFFVCYSLSILFVVNFVCHDSPLPLTKCSCDRFGTIFPLQLFFSSWGVITPEGTFWNLQKQKRQIGSIRSLVLDRPRLRYSCRKPHNYLCKVAITATAGVEVLVEAGSVLKREKAGD